MPDIVLTDGSGEPQTYAGAKALGVDTVDGGIAVFVSEDLLPAQYQHPSTHPASMITGLTPVATGGAYEKLFKKPFCDLPKLEETELAFELAYEGTELYTSETLSGAWENIEGETYTITWDGTPYTCVCKNIEDVEALNSTGALYFGNIASYFTALGATTITAEDTGEPFFVSIQHDYNYPDLIGKLVVATSDSSATHKISIIPAREAKPLDAKYLPDEAATKEWVEEAIAAGGSSGGSGGVTGEVEIFPEQEISLTPENVDDTTNTTYLLTDQSGGSLFTQLSQMKAGETYHVVLDGVEYICQDKSESFVTVFPDGYTVNAACVLGNGVLLDSGFADTGEPFAIEVLDMTVSGDDGTTTEQKVAAIIVKSDIAGAASVTHTVRIYQPASTVSWNNVTDKPFYDEIIEETLTEEITIGFTYDPDVDSAVYRIAFEPPESAVKLWESDWDAAEVMWDGISYIVEPAVLQGRKFVGNSDKMLGTGDNGLPFVIMIASAETTGGTAVCMIYAVYDPIEGTTEETTAEDGTVTTTTTYPTINHTVGCTLRFTAVHKIPDKYQHQTDWDETDDTEAAFVKNKPFGEMIKAGAVLINRDCGFTADDFGFVMSDLETWERYVDTSKVIEGGTYLVTVDGYQFVGTGVSGDTILTLYPHWADIGVESGIVSFEVDAQGVPKDVVVIGLHGVIDCIYLGDTTAYTADEFYPVSITVLDATKKIDQKYLPYGTDYVPGEKITSFTAVNASTIESSAEQAATLANAELYLFDYQVPSADDYWTESKFTTGETYAIIIGDKIHYAEAKRVEGEWEVAFGNLGILNEVAEALGVSLTGVLPYTGEDFVILSSDTNGVPTGGFGVYSRTNYGDSVSIAIYPTTEKVTQIESKYIPGPPFFDLTAMGLPTVMVDGTTVSVDCDTSKLCAALDTGLVKLCFTANNGSVDLPVSAITSALYVGGEYGVSLSGLFGGSPVMITITVTSSRISATFVPLATTSAT